MLFCACLGRLTTLFPKAIIKMRTVQLKIHIIKNNQKDLKQHFRL